MLFFFPIRTEKFYRQKRNIIWKGERFMFPSQEKQNRRNKTEGQEIL